MGEGFSGSEETGRALGKTEEQLSGWLRKKYGADGIGQLTDGDRREVVALLQGMLAKRAA